MITTNILKVIVGFSVFFFNINVDESLTNKIEVSELVESSVTVESETFKEEFLVYPKVSLENNKKTEKKVNAVLKSHIESSYDGYLKLKEEMEKFKEDEKEHCKEFPYSCEYSYITRYEVKFNNDGKLSILFYDATYSGGAHGLEGVVAYNFNTETGKLYSLKDLVSNESKFSSLTDYVKTYIENHQDFFFEEEMLSDLSINENTQFYFTESGVDLIFQQYEVAPYAAGHPIISIPNSEL